MEAIGAECEELEENDKGQQPLENMWRMQWIMPNDVYGADDKDN